MARRTITFAEGIEDGIREKQIEMMRQQKRDVPFTEAANWVVFQGLYWGAQYSGVPPEELAERVVRWIQGLDKISTDAFLDNIPVTQEHTPTKFNMNRSTALNNNAIELELNDSAPTYVLIPLPNDKRNFFPGFKEDFELITDIGALKAHVTSGPRGTPVGDPNAGAQIRGGLGKWYRRHPELKGGSKLRIEALEPGERYELSIVSK